MHCAWKRHLQNRLHEFENNNFYKKENNNDEKEPHLCNKLFLKTENNKDLYSIFSTFNLKKDIQECNKKPKKEKKLKFFEKKLEF